MRLVRGTYSVRQCAYLEVVVVDKGTEVQTTFKVEEDFNDPSNWREVHRQVTDIIGSGFMHHPVLADISGFLSNLKQMTGSTGTDFSTVQRSGCPLELMIEQTVEGLTCHVAITTSTINKEAQEKTPPLPPSPPPCRRT